MRWTAVLCFFALLLLFTPAHSQLGAPLGRCGPQPADPDWPRNQFPAEPRASSTQKKPAVDNLRLQHDARELADLSASVAGDMNRVGRGLLPKDVIDKLKRVEKLSKQLRGELTR
ncbi:MAG: hypothetical protein DMG81_01040 [Acidobacteria bacterium]|nr:MAG: hypothetical protein DMG81_01040 [Acidobacteriota bacterium]